MLNEKNGITLIALVITIIVLLILAGVTISMIVPKNGVVDKALVSSQKTNKSEAEEKVLMEVEGSYDGNGNVNLDFLNDNLRDNLGDIEFKYGDEEEYQELTEENKIEKLPVKVKYKTVEVEIEETASEYEDENRKKLDPKEYYGKYVDYGLDINGNGKTTDDWKIFYEDEKGRIFLIAADYVAHTCPAIADAIKNSGMIKNEGKSENGEEYETYYWKNGVGPEYHCNDGHNTSLNNDKKQCSFPEIFMPSGDFCLSHYYCSDHVGNDGKSGNANSRCASALQCTDNWKPFVEKSSNSQYAEYAIGGPTIEMWAASLNELNGSEDDKLWVSGDNNQNYGYKIGKTQDCSDGKFGGKNFDELYVPHNSASWDLDNDNIKETCFGCWFASPALGDNSEYYSLAVGFEGTIMSQYIGSNNCGIRPVICLKSNTKLEKNEDIYTLTR